MLRTNIFCRMGKRGTTGRLANINFVFGKIIILIIVYIIMSSSNISQDNCPMGASYTNYANWYCVFDSPNTYIVGWTITLLFVLFVGWMVIMYRKCEVIIN